MARFVRLPIRSAAFTCFLIASLTFGGCASSGPAKDDEERVAVGYGTVPESELTGAISRVNPDDVPEPVARLEDLLIGRVAGLDVLPAPGGGVRILIRGRSSLLGSNEPLYVIDGVPVRAGAGGGAPILNPGDIESVEILKDAGSTAIYGSRGANGVILITTKRAVDR